MFCNVKHFPGKVGEKKELEDGLPRFEENNPSDLNPLGSPLLFPSLDGAPTAERHESIPNELNNNENQNQGHLQRRGGIIHGKWFGEVEEVSMHGWMARATFVHIW